MYYSSNAFREASLVLCMDNLHPARAIRILKAGIGQVRDMFVPSSFHVRSLRNEEKTKMERTWVVREYTFFLGRYAE